MFSNLVQHWTDPPLMAQQNKDPYQSVLPTVYDNQTPCHPNRCNAPISTMRMKILLQMRLVSIMLYFCQLPPCARQGWKKII